MAKQWVTLGPDSHELILPTPKEHFELSCFKGNNIPNLDIQKMYLEKG